MDSLKNGNWHMKQRFVMASICAALLLLFSIDSLAQTVTSTPNSVEIQNLQPVVLRITKSDGSNDSERMGRVESVKVGDQLAKFHKDAEGITITPPKLPVGTQSVKLFDKDNNEIEKGQLVYQSVSSGGANAQSIQELSRRNEEARRDQLVKSNWYYLLVTLMFIAVLVPFVFAIYRGTSGSPALGNRPLGLPVGSFRSILAYSLVAYMGFFVLTSILSVSQFAPPEFLLGIVATVIGFYFGSRSSDEGETIQKAGIVRGIVRNGTKPSRGAMVKFKRSADGTEPYSRISDLDGRFELRGATPGKYKVCASLTGYNPSDEQEISVVEGSDHEIEILIKSAVGSQQQPSQTGIVQGTVTKPDGTPAPQASIVLTQGGSEKFKKTADGSGRYKIDGVTVGEYNVEATLSPHNPSDKATVKVISNGQHTVDLRLK
jgi:hypothetical protein